MEFDGEAAKTGVIVTFKGDALTSLKKENLTEMWVTIQEGKFNHFYSFGLAQGPIYFHSGMEYLITEPRKD